MATVKRQLKEKVSGGYDVIHVETSAEQVIQDSTRRFLTDAERITWNGKEDASNKKTTLADNSDTFYPSQKAVKTEIDALKLLARPSHTRPVVIESDFYDEFPYVIPGITSYALASGSSVLLSGQTDHPGISGIRNSTNANSGYVFSNASQYPIKLAGGEKTTYIFLPTAYSKKTTVFSKVGFIRGNITTTDGVFLQMNGDGTNIIISGNVINASSVTTTSTTYSTTDTGVWLRGEIAINADASAVVFTIYNSATNAVLWTSTVTQNMTAIQAMGFGLTAYNTAAEAASYLVYIDYYCMQINRIIAR